VFRGSQGAMDLAASGLFDDRARDAIELLKKLGTSAAVQQHPCTWRITAMLASQIQATRS